MQRAGVLAELPSLLTARGLDAARIFAEAGIDVASLSTEARLPFATSLKLLESAAEVSGCPHLGLMLGQRFELKHHGLLGELMRTAPTLGHALVDFTSWQPGYSSGAVVYLHPLGDDHAWGYGAAVRANRVLYDVIAVLGLRMVQQVTGGTVAPEEVHLPYRQPEDKAAYARYIPVPTRFNEQRFCLVLTRAALDTRLPGADHAQHQAILAELRTKLPGARAGAGLTARTRQVLRLLVQRGTPSMDAAAAELAMHPRTLRRHLAREETSFEALCGAVRFDMARELLDLTDLPVSEISTALAYASPSVFADAFRRWSGLSPLAFRRRNTPAPDARPAA